MINLFLITIVSLLFSFNPLTLEENQSSTPNEDVSLIAECSATLTSSGRCVNSLGDVCNFYSEFIINTSWESGEEGGDDEYEG